MAAPIGNKNASGPRNRIWADAIKRAVMRVASGEEKATNLDKLATKIVESGLSGDTSALKEIGDRLDGKPAQVVEGNPEAPLETVFRWASEKS